MKRAMSVFMVLLVIISPVMAQQTLGAQTVIKPKIKTIGFLGKGVAVSPDDPMNFMLAKTGIGTLKVVWAGEETELTIGILVLDDTRYKLKDITLEEGKASGDIFKNNTKVGTFDVSSVSKGNIDVWAGTVVIEDSTYYIYIIEAERPFKPVEIKEKVRAAVKNICASPSPGVASICRQGNLQNYCMTHPNDEKCKEIFKEYCIKDNKLRDARCRIFVKKYCEEHPEIEDCVLYGMKRATDFCKEHPKSRVCRTLEVDMVSYCLKRPNTQRCREYCAKYPEKCRFVVKNLADFCIEHPKHPNCIDYCKEHPKACQKLVKNLADFCIKQPNSEKCKEYCKAHPVACKLVSKELAMFCVGNAGHPKCVNYCKEHPGACKEVVADITSYCKKHPQSEQCQVFCEKHPRICKAVSETVNNSKSEVKVIGTGTVKSSLVSIIDSSGGQSNK